MTLFPSTAERASCTVHKFHSTLATLVLMVAVFPVLRGAFGTSYSWIPPPPPHPSPDQTSTPASDHCPPLSPTPTPTPFLINPNDVVGLCKVPGEIKRSRDLRGGRWSWTFKLAPKRSRVGRWTWAAKAGLLLLRVVQVVRQQQCNGHCLSDSVQHSS